MDEFEIGYSLGQVVGESCFAGDASGWGRVFRCGRRQAEVCT